MKIAELLMERGDTFDVSTSSSNKINKIDPEIYGHINVPSDQHVVMLVGPSDGLKRHVDAAVKMGVKDLSYLWIIDNLPGTIKELKGAFEEMKRSYEGEPHFIHSDLLDFLNDWDEGKIYFVDFDGVKTASMYHVKVYERCKELGVKYLSLVGTTNETPDPELRKIAKNYPQEVRDVNPNKATQLATRGKYTRGYKKKQLADVSTPEAMRLHLKQTNLLSRRNYKGAGSDDPTKKGKGGSQMWVYLFKL